MCGPKINKKLLLNIFVKEYLTIFKYMSPAVIGFVLQKSLEIVERNEVLRKISEIGRIIKSSTTDICKYVFLHICLFRWTIIFFICPLVTLTAINSTIKYTILHRII